MSSMVIDIPPVMYQRLQEQARKAGKSPEALTRDLLDRALQAEEGTQPRTARAVLQAAGRARPLSETLRRRIIPGVTLEEVRESLTQAGGPSLSNVVLEQRGPKP